MDAYILSLTGFRWLSQYVSLLPLSLLMLSHIFVVTDLSKLLFSVLVVNFHHLGPVFFPSFFSFSVGVVHGQYIIQYMMIFYPCYIPNYFSVL